jgi:hypothetical protein
MPTGVELAVTAGIWALGMFVLTVLVKVALPIEMGEVRSPYLAPDRPLDATGVRTVPPSAFPAREEERDAVGAGANA